MREREGVRSRRKKKLERKGEREREKNNKKTL